MFRRNPTPVDVEALKTASRFSRWHLRWHLKRGVAAVRSIRFSLRSLLCFVLFFASATTLWWNWAPWVLQHKLRGHTESVVVASFSPDGKKIVTGSSDTTARLWDAESGTLIHVFAGHTNRLSSVGFSSDGRFVISQGWDVSTQTWDVASGQQISKETGFLDRGTENAFSPDKLRMVTPGFRREAQVWAQRRPEYAWGVLVLPELWLTLVFAGALIWSVRRDRRGAIGATLAV